MEDVLCHQSIEASVNTLGIAAIVRAKAQRTTDGIVAEDRRRLEEIQRVDLVELAVLENVVSPHLHLLLSCRLKRLKPASGRDISNDDDSRQESAGGNHTCRMEAT